jgi:hypothetical protein
MISMAAFTIGQILRFKTTNDYSKNPNWHKGAPGKWFRAKREMPAAAPENTGHRGLLQIFPPRQDWLFD